MWPKLPPDPFFSDAFLSELFARFDIGPEYHSRVQTLLDGAASDWKEAQVDGLSPRELRAHLESVELQAKTLQEMLSVISGPVWRELLRAGDLTRSGAPDEPYLSYDSSPLLDVADEPEPCIILPGDYLGADSKRINLSDLAVAFELLSELSTHAQRINPPVKRGVQIDIPLRRWVQDIQHMWERVLNRSFTRDVDAYGEPISEAACFCVGVYRQMHPNTPRSRVLNEMKIAIQTRRSEQEEFPKF
jgi:hypothetical protein